MSELNIALATIGGLVLVLGLVSQPLKQSIVTAPLLACLAGVLLGPAAFGLLEPQSWVEPALVVEETARVTIAIGLMSVALRLPHGFLPKQARPLAVLMLAGMPLMWLFGGLLAYALLGVPFLLAMLVGAVAAPTDPVVATAVLTGRVAVDNVPARLRHTLLAESALNDGLAHPLVLLPLVLLAGSPDTAWPIWLLHLVWEVLAAAVFGVLLGYATGRLLLYSEAKHTIDAPSFLAFTVALSLLALGSAALIGTEGLIAVFFAGAAFNHVVGPHERTEEEKVQEAVNQFFVLPIFVLFGLIAPWQEWLELGWRAPVLAAGMLLLRRLPMAFLLRPLVPVFKGRGNSLFAGWFGPMGIATLFYAINAARRSGDETVWIVGSLLIAASIVAHSTTAAPFARLYGRYR